MAQAGVDGGTAMIPMYYSFIPSTLCLGVLDGNWILWLVHQKEFTLYGLISLEAGP